MNQDSFQETTHEKIIPFPAVESSKDRLEVTADLLLHIISQLDSLVGQLKDLKHECGESFKELYYAVDRMALAVNAMQNTMQEMSPSPAASFHTAQTSLSVDSRGSTPIVEAPLQNDSINDWGSKSQHEYKVGHFDHIRAKLDPVRDKRALERMDVFEAQFFEALARLRRDRQAEVMGRSNFIELETFEHDDIGDDVSVDSLLPDSDDDSESEMVHKDHSTVYNSM